VAETTKIIIRDAEYGDKSFIFSTWLKGVYYGCTYFRQMPQDLYYDLQGDQITKVLQDPSTHIRIACDQDDPPWVVGFCVYKNSDLHWIYVKLDFRKKGIARLLMQGVEIQQVKAMTRVGKAIADNHGLIFNPF
jgi:hypothetical protein